MTTPRYRPPSWTRYAATHPTLTVHFDADLYAKVIALRERSGLTLNQLVRQALGSLERHVETILARGVAEGRKAGYDEGWRAGYREAATRFRLSLPCHACGQPIELRPDSKDARELVKYCVFMEMDHAECPPRPASPQT